MKLVIDIPEEVITNETYTQYFGCMSAKLDEVIHNGTSLPIKWLSFEIMIMDMVEELKFNDADSLSDFSAELHEHIETALQDYADDMGFGEDYEPQF